MQNLPTTDVHDALERATIADASSKSAPATVKMDPKAKELGDQICKQHGTSLPAFMRECVYALVLDYNPGLAKHLGRG